ncbi:hypothetical protein GQ607_004752 [Colletotrichum asianum]|uniref:F-box domain-containing protein n=1 Tax=Colletotrichum asianum TaxID=702518 RepID=A0A8H3WLD9_9PEZI|nr:hypothetical protein GQ607_004752 [Colletotrichum asianum]
MTAISMEQPHAENHQSAPANGLVMAVFDREHRNRVQSRLCALPEELVLDIMSSMRLTELYLTAKCPISFSGSLGQSLFENSAFPKNLIPQAILTTGTVTMTTDT